jgi:hypothetical protein
MKNLKIYYAVNIVKKNACFFIQFYNLSYIYVNNKMFICNEQL